ncbi:MAG TPA: NAD(P)-dependent oxidoreductase [Candidatus Peribacterales bacterium]|nr:NAD(P)-dependent oxidoreductase [Candidatus Peribacterales bacterium]
MINITFLEVDSEDQLLVKKNFPSAQIIDHPLEGDALVDACKNAEVLSFFIYSKLTKEVIAKLPKLKLLCTRSVGYNHIDLEVCKEKGITVCNVPDYGSHVIAEHVFALLLSQLRHIQRADESVEKGEFDYHGLRGMSLRGKTIGILGTGKIGRKVAEIAYGFGMRILAFDRCRTKELEENCGVQYVPLDQIFEESDIISLHLVSNEQTFHIINDVALHRMKKGIILVNTARGELIDTQALISALKGGKIGYALLDVLEHEKNFEENKELIGFKNVITTPHIGFYADDSMLNMYTDCFESIAQWQRGEVPVHIIKPKNIVCDLPAFNGKKS